MHAKLDDPITQMRFHIARITDKTLWSFLEIRCASGAEGIGEASLAGRERTLVDAAVAHLPRWLAGEPLPDLDVPPPLPVAALRTALDVARCDAAARREGVSLARRLGGDEAARIPLYANINRRTRDRAPAGFAASAAHAVGRGFDAVKIAPFDEVGPQLRDDAEGCAALEEGIARIAAVREAIGPDRRLMVDCHWRFGEALSARLVDAISPFGLYWLECPVAEEPAQIPALSAMRSRLNARGTLLAGLEEFTGAPAFLAYADAYDVMMPDMKYVGGVDEMLRTAEQLAERGIAVSP
ncbi:enolase C-terminal domain-like protein, partial [Bosea sp. (in: a-proteobacteria)]|uniref:enolase C-terminal domain-like protein n=1 Tax=Bosea sp. (in: a-proteobacteria) TaxID=1871050 RepID=UPI002FC7FFA5